MKINKFKKTGNKSYDPVEFVDSRAKKNWNFFVIKIRTSNNQPRIILELNTSNILAIVTHNDYDAIRWKKWNVILLKWIEDRKHWFNN